MKDRILYAMASDLGIDRFENESEMRYCSRVLYSAMASWVKAAALDRPVTSICLSVLDASIVTSAVADLLRKVKYAVCSQEFAESLTGIKIDYQDPESMIKVYQVMKKKHLKTEFVVTLGERGALYCINNQIKVSPSLKVNAIDTHGCGDVFRAAFAYTLANGGDVEKAVKMGNIAAGLAATKYGAREAIPSLEEITNIYEQSY